MLYALLALAVFGLITSSVFTGMVLWAVPGYLRERRAAYAKLDHPAGIYSASDAAETAARRGARSRSAPDHFLRAGLSRVRNSVLHADSG